MATSARPAQLSQRSLQFPSTREGSPRHSDLETGGTRPMRILGKQAFVAQLEQTLSAVLHEHAPEVMQASGVAIRSDLRYEVLALLRRGKRVRGIHKQDFLARLDQSRQEVLEKRGQTIAELGQLEQRASELRSTRAQPARPRPVDGTIEDSIRALFAESELARACPTALRQDVLAFALSAASCQRAVAANADKQREIGLLERRIAKLNGSLAKMEQMLQQLAKMKDIELGESSIYRAVQGLSELDELYAQKREMLQDIFEANAQLFAAVA